MATRKLTVRWSKRERDFMFNAPRKVDGMLAHDVLCCPRLAVDDRWLSSFVEELKRRGYDVTTLRFSVELAKEMP